MTTKLSKGTRALLMTGRWFRGLSPAFQDAILASGEERTLKPDELIFNRGGPPCGLYAMLNGAVRFSGTTAAGKEAILTMVEAPNWFGETSIFDGLPRTHDAVATVKSKVLNVPQEKVLALFAAHPLFWRDLGLLLCQKLRLTFMELEGTAMLPALERVARRLVVLAEGHGDLHAHSRRVLKVPQDQLAAMLSISRQTINALLKELQEKGAIKITYGEIEIVDLAVLKTLSGS